MNLSPIAKPPSGTALGNPESGVPMRRDSLMTAFKYGQMDASLFRSRGPSTSGKVESSSCCRVLKTWGFEMRKKKAYCKTFADVSDPDVNVR